jgi:hypothetical protein
MTKEKECPKCKKPGSLHLKTVFNKQGKQYHYLYVAHYVGLSNRTRKIRWHYIGNKSRSAIKTLTIIKTPSICRIPTTTRIIVFWQSCSDIAACIEKDPPQTPPLQIPRSRHRNHDPLPRFQRPHANKSRL